MTNQQAYNPHMSTEPMTSSLEGMEQRADMTAPPQTKDIYYYGVSLNGQTMT